METTLVVTVGGEEFPLDDPSVQEVRNVKRWTGFVSQPQWFTAVIREDADALLAAYVIVKRRKGEQAEFNDTTDFPATVTARIVDGQGREVEPVVQLNSDGSVVLVDGLTVPVMDKEGNPQWRDVESGTVIPFRLTTTPETTAPTLPVPTSTGATDIGIPATGVL